MCIFCDIVNNRIPSYKIYEDADVLAFLDLSQVTKGHTLVIPKNHYASYLECDDEILCKVNKVVRMLAIKYSKTLDCKGFNILSNVNEVAGQSVLHFHMHLIPRYSLNDDCVIEFKESAKQDLEGLHKLLKTK